MFTTPPYSTISLHLLASLIKAFITSLLVFSPLLVVFGSASDLYTNDLSLGTALQLLPFLIPDALRWAIPPALLLATVSVYGKLAADNELLALKSLGISPIEVFYPVLILGCGLVFPTVWLMDVANSWGHNGVQRVVLESVDEIAYSLLRSEGSYKAHSMMIATQRVEGETLFNVTVSIRPGEGREGLTAMAERARLRCDRTRHEMQLSLINGSVEFDSGKRLVFPNQILIRAPLSAASRKAMNRQFTLRQLPAAIADQAERVRSLEEHLAVRLVSNSASKQGGTVAGPGAPVVAPSTASPSPDELSSEKYRLFRLKCFVHRRWAHGVSCLAFVLFGAPLAIYLRTADMSTAFFISFLPILVCYYPLEYGMASTSVLPHWSVWLGNLLLAIWGIVMIRACARR